MSTALQSDITYADYFCGWGGSSQGARKRGLRIVMAANHWELAVEVHNLNFPESDHDLADLSQVEPRRHPGATVGWFSPECTNHTKGNGKKKPKKETQLNLLQEQPVPTAAEQRSRATMWDVVRFSEYHRYRYVIVENVVEVLDWELYDAWMNAMRNLGYECKPVFLNSMHASSDLSAPAPQSRDRVYFVFWQRGENAPDLDITPNAWCEHCDEQIESRQAWKNPLKPRGRYREQYVYICPGCKRRVEPYTLPAASAVDLTNIGERIGDKPIKKFTDKNTGEITYGPLAIKTLRRMEAGVRKHWRPFVLEAAGNQYDAADPKHNQHGQLGAYWRTWDLATEPLRTLQTVESKALALPPLLTTTKSRSGRTQDATTEPMPTQTTHHVLAVVQNPLVVELRGGGSTARPAAHPLSTVTAGGNHHGLLQGPALDSMIMRNNGSRGDGGEMCTPIAEPLRTLTTKGHQSLVTWQSLYGYDSGHIRALSGPMPTQTTIAGDGLVSGTMPEVLDCYFRMLDPFEIAAGMAFEPGYQVLGNKREQIKGYGNAVTPCASTLLCDRVVDAITGVRVAA